MFTLAAGFDAETAHDALFVEGDGDETMSDESDFVVMTDLNQALVGTDLI